jgi:hypothetical protein
VLLAHVQTEEFEQDSEAYLTGAPRPKEVQVLVDMLLLSEDKVKDGSADVGAGARTSEHRREQEWRKLGSAYTLPMTIL